MDTLQRQTGNLIAALANRPEIPLDIVYIWEAFWLLNESRPVGFGIGPIPLSEMKAYIELFGAPDANEFVTCVRHMDCKYLAWQRQKSEREQQSVHNSD